MMECLYKEYIECSSDSFGNNLENIFFFGGGGNIILKDVFLASGLFITIFGFT